MAKKKNKYFFFEKPHLNHILFLLYFLISLAENSIGDIFETTNNISTPFFEVYIYNLSDFLSIIPFLIIKARIRKKNPFKTFTTMHSNMELDLIYNNRALENKKGFTNILMLAFIDYTAQISMAIYYIFKQEYKLDVQNINLNSTFIFNIIFIIILSKLLLNTQFYRHHYFSSLIIIICLFVLVVLDIIQIFTDKEVNKLFAVIYLILRIIKTFFYSFEDVLGKVILLYNNFTVYSLLLNKAIIQFIFSIFFSIPFIFIKVKDEKDNERSIFVMIGEMFDNKINILKYCLYTIICFFYNVFLWQIIDKFSPNHFWLAQIFEGLGLLIVSLIKDSVSLDSYLRLAMYILLLIIASIYNEFLVVNICGLSQDTKLFLDFKEEEDLFLANNSKEDINSEESIEDRILKKSLGDEI